MNIKNIFYHNLSEAIIHRETMDKSAKQKQNFNILMKMNSEIFKLNGDFAIKNHDT